jgi:hypothetical protein
MQTALKDLLEKRRNRVIASILSVKERECDPQLTEASSHKLRKVVLDQVNEWHSLVLDILGSLDTGDVVLNEDYMHKIDELHDAIVGVNS